jgi:phage-related protein
VCHDCVMTVAWKHTVALRRHRKPLVPLTIEIKTPPLSKEARVAVGNLLSQIQDGEPLGMPLSRPMPSIGPRCHELRIQDKNRTWRAVYRIDQNAILLVDLFPKTTQQTPVHVIKNCKKRLKDYDEAEKARKGNKR